MNQPELPKGYENWLQVYVEVSKSWTPDMGNILFVFHHESSPKELALHYDKICRLAIENVVSALPTFKESVTLLRLIRYSGYTGINGLDGVIEKLVELTRERR